MNWIDEALAKRGADAHSALRVRLLCVKAMALLPLRRRAEEHTAMTDAEAIARALEDPVSISQALQLRAHHEFFLGRDDVTQPFADEALYRQ